METYISDMANERETPSSASTTSTTTTTTTMTMTMNDMATMAMNDMVDATNSKTSFGSEMIHGIESIAIETVRDAKSRGSETITQKLTLHDFSFIQRLGSGDIGTVYLVELKGSKGCVFAAKMMDKEELVCRNKEGRAGTEREILEILDHPFLPFLYTTIECPRWSCLLTEFCPGGDLHVLRQRQPEKRFDEDAVRFYASEVIVALEYLHMLGIVYRDLKPENVLVKSDGHIMLTDFDLSLKCDDSSTSKPQIVYDQLNSKTHKSPSPDCSSRRFSIPSCILPRCVVPSVSCLHPTRRRRRKGTRTGLKIVAEPIEARSMSFVGTHEYLAPEIVSGEGHGNAVDWWTLGVFIYELFYGVTPFKGTDNEFTLSNIVALELKFPKDPLVPASAKDLIIQLLNKDPTKRMGSTMGAAAMKQHPFFDGVNWALLRCTKPPYIPKPFEDFVSLNNNDPFDVNVEYY